MAIGNITFAGPMGAVKFNLHEYTHTMQMGNGTNYPVKVSRYTLKCRNDIPGQFYVDSAGDPSVLPGIFTWDYLVAWMANQSLEASNTGTPATIMRTITGISPWKTGTAGEEAQTAITMPGFQLTDIPLFNHYFKFVGTKSKELLPGRTLRWITKSKRLRVYDTAKIIDSSFYAAGGSILSSLRCLHLRGHPLYIYKFEPMTGTSHLTPNVSTTLAQTQVNCVQTYRYITSVSSQPTHQMYGANNHLPTTGTTVSNFVPFTGTAANYTIQ